MNFTYQSRPEPRGTRCDVSSCVPRVVRLAGLLAGAGHGMVGRLAMIVLAGAMLGVAGCASPKPYEIDLMPAPDVYDQGIDPFSDDHPLDTIPYAGILYTTDRAPAEEGAKEHYYLNRRGHVMRMGVARFSLGSGQLEWEEARQVSLLKNRTDRYPVAVTGVEEIGTHHETHTSFTDPALLVGDPRLPARRFASFINEKLAQSERKDVYIYVHGYKVVFENPLLVATELWHFLGYDGVIIAYAWPSTPKRLAYASDIETAALSAHNLRQLLEYLAGETDARRIHIVGFSAGTRVVLTALHQLALEGKGMSKDAFREAYNIGHVLLMGSDFDRHLFGAYLTDGLLDVPDDLSVYMSRKDKALGFSRWLFRRERLGQMWKEGKPAPQVDKFLREHPELTLIDVTDAESATAGNGHAYLRESPWVSSDILMTLRYDLPPEKRGIVRVDETPIWTFPNDYVSRLRVKLAGIYPELAEEFGLEETAKD